MNTKKKVQWHLHATLFSFDCPHPLPAASRYLIQIPLSLPPLSSITNGPRTYFAKSNPQRMITNRP